MLEKQQFSRINLVELKALIFRKIGRPKAERYFHLLQRLFSLKISKCQFDKFCLRVLGKENLILHNLLIQSIIKNACLANVPPGKARKEVGSLNVKNVNGNRRNSLQSLYGDAFLPSPRKYRSFVNRDCSFQDQPSPLGLFGKPQSVLHDEYVSGAQVQQSPAELLSLGTSRPPVEVASVEDGEEVEQVAGSPSIQSKSQVTAPLGISMNSRSARKALCDGSVHNFYPEACNISRELPDTRSLRSRLEQKSEMEGLSVSVDCASLLNIGLDAYLKRLIEPCIGLAASRCRNECLPESSRRTPHLNGTGTLPGRLMEMSRNSICASMLDFRTAVELNPKILGEDQAIQLEKICIRASEE